MATLAFLRAMAVVAERRYFCRSLPERVATEESCRAAESVIWTSQRRRDKLLRSVVDNVTDSSVLVTEMTFN